MPKGAMWTHTRAHTCTARLDTWFAAVPIGLGWHEVYVMKEGRQGLWKEALERVRLLGVRGSEV